MKHASAVIALSLVLSSVAPASAAEPARDLSMEDAAMAYAISHGILPATEDGQAHPERMVRRSEFAVAVVEHLYGGRPSQACFLALAPSLPVRYTLLFRDVAKTAPEARHLCMGMVAGIVNGDASGFRPADVITAAEAAKMLAQGYGLISPSLIPSGAPWYASSMQAIGERGGLTATMVPETPLTRLDAARMFYVLRNQERFPLKRIIAKQTASVRRGGAAPVLASKNSGNRVLHVMTPRMPQADASVTAAQTLSSGRFTAHRISRRSLLLRERINATDAQ